MIDMAVSDDAQALVWSCVAVVFFVHHAHGPCRQQAFCYLPRPIPLKRLTKKEEWDDLLPVKSEFAGVAGAISHLTPEE